MDSLESTVASILSAMKTMANRDEIETKLNRHSKQCMVIQGQTAKATESKLDAMQRHITSMDSKLKEVQRRTDGRMRMHSESTQSQSVEILAQIAALTQQMGVLQQEFAVLKESENKDGDEEVQEQPEAEKLREWMRNEVKLPRYFNVLKDNGFDNMESLQDLTSWDLKEMGIDKMGHRRRIMRNVNMRQMRRVKSSSKYQHLFHSVTGPLSIRRISPARAATSARTGRPSIGASNV